MEEKRPLPPPLLFERYQETEESDGLYGQMAIEGARGLSSKFLEQSLAKILTMSYSGTNFC
jgi:hypothetical protein